MVRVLIPLPARDFDPSEAAVRWQVLSNAGHAVIFATPDGQPAAADDMMLTGEGLDLWGTIPLLQKLPLVGLLMRANRDARRAYAAMIAAPNYSKPLRWDAVDPSAFDGLLLPGGHRARGMRDYLESVTLQRHVADFFAAKKTVAAVACGRAQLLSPNGPLRSLRLQDDRADLGARKQRLESCPHHAVLGPGLLSDLSGADW